MEAVQRSLILLLCLTGAAPNPVLRQPPSASVAAGGAGTLSCRVQNLNVRDYGGFWYRERSERRLEWVLTHWASGSIDRSSGITERYQPSWDSVNNTYLLTVNSVAKADMGTYYCAMYYNNQVHFGNGIHLLIPSRQLSAPTVHLYPPSKEELARARAADAAVTLSCLASGFYPGYVRARWTLDGEETEGAGPGKAALEDNGSYSWGSYLTLPASRWGSHSLYSCQVWHESSQEPIVHTVDRETCELQ
ncbi:immunoglobulin lambda-1 light chain-like [Heptranchias perlo]|uniref:immunoglobulin lambda-1 light chain-like n=1 Tax=Heptranchias perlo TaxID=212740 RepID=UPI00355A1D83